MTYCQGQNSHLGTVLLAIKFCNLINSRVLEEKNIKVQFLAIYLCSNRTYKNKSISIRIVRVVAKIVMIRR